MKRFNEESLIGLEDRHPHPLNGMPAVPANVRLFVTMMGYDASVGHTAPRDIAFAWTVASWCSTTLFNDVEP